LTFPWRAPGSGQACNRNQDVNVLQPQPLQATAPGSGQACNRNQDVNALQPQPLQACNRNRSRLATATAPGLQPQQELQALDSLEVTMHCPNCGHELVSESQTTIQTCGRCSGKGRDAFQKLCQGCGGAGSVRTSSPPVRCAACQGKGQDVFGHGCQVCQGTGWARL